MPKGIAVVFSFFLLFFRCLISEVTKRISTKFGHIFTYDCYLKNLAQTPLGIYPHGLQGKKHAFGTNFELWPNISLLQNLRAAIKKKIVNLLGLPYMPPPQIWWTYVQKRLRTVGEFLPTPLNFCIGRHCQPMLAWTLYNRQWANFSTHYVVAPAYSLEQQNAGRALVGLCHASSSVCSSVTFWHSHILSNAFHKQAGP